MIPIKLPEEPPREGQRRRFRMATSLIAGVALLLVILQYTPYALLPARKTDTLWGVLTGIVFMSVVIEWTWRDAARRQRERSRS